ncbi:hypothetical protein GCM10010156_00690 [Planobispora rosea]|uniref:Potassium transporter TrkA n=1 Tax=Planobispora rosea TaxID=35762 RepID=A0A8J3RWB6_PLARO|nr:potassium transporter TrkA [Planobispora rosea]GGS45905.1 hypothetical protein GCM10010156_00690 [Planobispora rosea]GIH82418.1 hypothetical protein Pro02_08260 [Planobispora rosea]
MTALAVIGTGGLARAVCYALAVTGPPARITVIGRDPARTAELCHVGMVRAALAGSGVTFHPMTGPLTEALAAAAPAGVLLAASSQSPWESLSSPSAWTSLLRRGGFGLTLPFQAEAAIRAGTALASAAPGSWFVNACFPDAVNPVLAAYGVPALCGIGNVGLLAASLQTALGLADQRELQVLAHHAHLHAPPSAGDEARVWHRGRALAGVGTLLAAQRAASRTELNHVTGLAAARVLGCLLTGGDLDTSLPGPLGLPGGYPVRLAAGRLSLRLPPGLDRAEAVAFNQRSAVQDGVVVEGARVTFGPAAREELTRVAPDLADGFPVADLDPAVHAFTRLRDRLRDLPAYP